MRRAQLLPEGPSARLIAAASRPVRPGRGLPHERRGRPPRIHGPDSSRLTPARIGARDAPAPACPPIEVLRFGLAHAQARDAVHMPFDAATVETEIRALGFETLRVESAAPARDVYLRRPDLGRRLSEQSRTRLAARQGPPVDLALVVADGLSAAAIHAQTAPLPGRLQALDRTAGLEPRPGGDRRPGAGGPGRRSGGIAERPAPWRCWWANGRACPPRTASASI